MSIHEYKSKVDFFKSWWVDQRKYKMSSDDWQYIGLLLYLSLMSFGVGLLVGLLWML